MILPGDSMKVPFIFKSPNAGIFSEQWQFETKPVLCGGAALVVTLRGVALQEDHYQEQRNEIEEELGRIRIEILCFRFFTVYELDDLQVSLTAYEIQIPVSDL